MDVQERTENTGETHDGIMDNGRDPKPVKARFVKTINIKHCQELLRCSINGAVLITNDILAVIDTSNCSVKLIDLRLDMFTSFIRIHQPTFDITCMDQNSLVVTCDEELVFLRNDDEWSVVKRVPMEPGCRGITYSNHKLFVTFTGNHAVRVLNDEGHVLKTFKHDEHDEDLFRNPLHIALNNDGSIIYVSNWGADTVTSLDMDGKVLNTYNHERLTCPTGLTAGDDGSIYVAGRSSNTIHQITRHCTRVRIILDEKDGVTLPQIVLYNNTDNTLYVAPWYSADMFVYKLEKISLENNLTKY